MVGQLFTTTGVKPSAPDAAAVYDMSAAPAQIATLGSDRLRSRAHRKCVIAFVTCSVVALLALASALVAVYLFTRETETALRYNTYLTLADQPTANQETTSYASDNVIVKHVTPLNGSGAAEHWLLSDFNREIQVMKTATSSASSAVCYVTPLNRSLPMLQPDSLPEQPDQISTEAAETHQVQYAPFGQSILDTSLLGARGQQLCAGVPVYWALPVYLSASQYANNAVAMSRRKRQVYYNYAVCTQLECVSVMYSGDPNTYVSCSRVPCGSVSTTIATTSTTPAVEDDLQAVATTACPPPVPCVCTPQYYINN